MNVGGIEPGGRPGRGTPGVAPFGGGGGGGGHGVNRALQLGSMSPVPNLTAERIAAQGAGTHRINFLTLIGNNSPGLGWISISVDRPTLIIPATAPADLLLYTPLEPGRPTYKSSNDGDNYALRSSAGGVCYFWAPGVWWIKYRASGVNIQVLQVPAEDPSQAGKYLSAPGCHAATPPGNVGNANTAGHLESNGGAANSVSIPANVFRRALWIQNNTLPATTDPVRIGLGAVPDDGTAGTTAGMAKGAGLAVYAGGFLQLAGDSLWLGAVVLKSASPFAVDFVEFI